MRIIRDKPPLPRARRIRTRPVRCVLLAQQVRANATAKINQRRGTPELRPQTDRENSAANDHHPLPRAHGAYGRPSRSHLPLVVDRIENQIYTKNKMRTKGLKIKTLQALVKAAAERRSVISDMGFRGRLPAAVALNYQARYVAQMIDAGLYIYNGSSRVDLTTPPKKWNPITITNLPPPLLLENK